MGRWGEYKSGWIGLRSVPRTSDEGYFWARNMSINSQESVIFIL